MKKMWIPLVVVGVLVIGYLIADLALAARAHSALAALKQAGDPTTIAEIAIAQTPETRAAGELLTRAALGLPDNPVYDMAVADSIGYSADPALSDRLLQQYSGVIARVCSAAAYRSATFDFRYEDGWAAKLSTPPSRLHEFARLLRMEARKMADEGKNDSALAVLGVAAHLSGMLVEPILLYCLMGIAGFDQTLREAQQVAPRASIAALEGFRRELSGLDFYSSFRRAVQGEMVLAEQGIRLRQRLGAVPNLPVNPLTLGPVRNCIRAKHLSAARQRLAALSRPLPEALGALGDSVAKMPTVQPAKWVQSYIPNMAPFARRLALATCSRDICDVGVAVLISRRRTGQTPKTIADIETEQPIDPYSGEPYRFKALPNGFVIWGVGKDRTDDGGDPQQDIVWQARF